MNTAKADSGSRRSAAVLLVSGLLAALVLTYAVAIVVGIIASESRLGIAEVALLTLAGVLVIGAVNPDLAKWLRSFEAFGIRIERIEAQQVQQTARLEAFGMVLPLLLSERHQQHLMNLANAKTGQYIGRETFRNELRRLCSLELITMVGDHQVNDMKDEMLFDLAEFIALTDRGREWVDRIRELHSHDAQAASANANLPRTGTEEPPRRKGS